MVRRVKEKVVSAYNKVPSAPDDYSTVLSKFPVAVGAIIELIMVSAWAVEEVVKVVKFNGSPLTISPIIYIRIVLQVLHAIAAMITTAAKKRKVCKFVIITYKVLCIATIPLMLAEAVMWVLHARGISLGEIPGKNPDWRPTTAEIAQIVVGSLFNIIILASSYKTLGVFKSMEKIMDNGGTGWEKKNYKECADCNRNKLPYCEAETTSESHETANASDAKAPATGLTEAKMQQNASKDGTLSDSTKLSEIV